MLTRIQQRVVPATLALTAIVSAATYAAPQLTTLRTTQRNKKPVVNITLALPQLKGTGARNFNAAVKGDTDREVASFRNDVSEYSKYPPAPPYDKGENVLEVTHQVKFSNARYISVLMSKYINFPGAAHPSSGTYMVTYDLRAQKPVGLGDLFKPGTPYLRTLSAYCRPVLRQNLGDAPDPTGLTPTAKNFAHWNLTRQGLLLTFDPYQVAPYAAGPQAVTVPYARLRSIMKPAVVAGLK